MAAWTVWLILAGFFIILEIATEGFLVFWFGVGALFAVGTSFLVPENILIQIAVFVIVSIILVLSTRKLTDKIKPKETPSNVYTIIGKKAVVLQTINNSKSQGQIKIDGDVWSAKTENDEIISEGASVEILGVDGVKTVVNEIK